MSKSITIIGATGSLGRNVTARLIEKGVEVTAIVRDIEAAKIILPQSVNLVYGDVENTNSLCEALKGTSTLYITLNTTSLDTKAPFHTEREGVMNITDAAKATGVNHIMQIAGIDYEHQEFFEKGMMYQTNLIRKPGIDYIKASGIPYTLFLCSFFLDSFPAFIQDGQFGMIGNHVHPIFYTNTTDLSLHIFNAINNEKTYHKTFTVQGKQGMSLPEAAKRFISRYNPSITLEHYPIEAVAAMGLPEEQQQFMTHMLTFVEQLKEQQISEPTWALLGEPTTTIESFAESIN